MKKLFGTGIMVVAMTAFSLRAQDGAPDAKPEVRAVAAIKTLTAEKEVSLLYVKGMT